MPKPIIDMQKLPDSSGLHETIFGVIHGAPYKVVMDGLDCYIYESNANGDLKTLCRMAGSEITERLGIALLRAASIQRDAEAQRNLTK